MPRRSVLLATSFALLWCVVLTVSRDLECGVPTNINRKLSISVFGKRNSTGDRVTFSALKDWNNSPDGVRVDVKHSVIDCGGKQMIHIQGVIGDGDIEEEVGDLLFHNNCGTSVAVINNGRSAQKIYVNEFFGGGLLTNRPLKHNERFEVRLENLTTKFVPSVAIGVTTQSPDETEIPPDMNRLRPKTWMFYDADLWNNFTLVLKDYGKNLNNLKAGDRIGVMRSGTGTLHLYVNGIDQGPAASRLPDSVYGVFELRGKAVKASIVGAPFSPPSS